MFNEKKYYSTLKFILIKTIYDYDCNAKVEIMNSLNGGIYGEITSENKITSEVIQLIKSNMKTIISNKLPITPMMLTVEEIENKVPLKNRIDIIALMNSNQTKELKVNKLDNFYDYFHNELYENTEDVSLFDLEEYNGGFILRYPFKVNPSIIAPSKNHPRLAKVFKESNEWGKILEVKNVGSLNKIINMDDTRELVMVNEALHHKKIAEISNDISKNKSLKLVTIAGPSSSGKTTFTKRLAIHLRVNGLKPVVISLDDYYRGRKYVPLDDNGEKNFEALEALDLELLNEQLPLLTSGKKVEVPIYNFHTGEREAVGKQVQLKDNGILLIEGIHGLNPNLTINFPSENKFNIYISCLTTLNIDDHNRIPSSEVRKLRRIVRDSLSRGTSAEGTLAMWDSVRRGEEKYIFPYQEKANAIFDSNLIYEIAVLKKHALKELQKIKVTSKFFDEAEKLISFLKYFKDIENEDVPKDSILKEFIGGSYFYKY